MRVLNEMKLSFPSRSANEAFARTALSAFTAAMDPTIEELADIKTAVSEAVTNAIVHGYREEIGTVYIHAKILEKKQNRDSYPRYRLWDSRRKTGDGAFVYHLHNRRAVRTGVCRYGGVYG